MGSVIPDFISNLLYDLVLWFFSIVVDTYFREIESVGSYNLPKQGPVILVIAPHANQFVDPVLVMEKFKEHTGRNIAFLVAGKSYRQRFIGLMSRLAGAIPVERTQDHLKKAKGIIRLEKDDRESKSYNEGEDNYVKIVGEGTKFTTDCKIKSLLALPHSLGSSQVEEIASDTVLYLNKPFKINRKDPSERDHEALDILDKGTEFKAADPIDNHIVFNSVFKHLNAGRVLGIFPEGGSHDRPKLLPLKAGVAIMALGAVTTDDNSQPITVIPTGMNYFHPHKFRSRCVVEFGKPIVIDRENWGSKYKEHAKETVSELLKQITLGVEEVTVNCVDYETLMTIHAVRRLYTSHKRDEIPLSVVIEMNRRLIKAYEKYKERDDVQQLKKEVFDYNKKLKTMGIHDHQVEDILGSDRLAISFRFCERLFVVLLFCGLALPGVILFSPVFIVSKVISVRKSQEALAASVVKLKAKDVVATWKILVALVWAPCIYIFWSIIGTILLVKSKYLEGIVPTWLIFVGFYLWAVLTTYASLRIGEIGVDYYKSLKPLFYSVLSYHMDKKQLQNLKDSRKKLSAKVQVFFEKYGPSMFDDYSEFLENLSVNSIDDYKQDYEQKSFKVKDFDINDLSNIPIFSTFQDEEHERQQIYQERSRKKQAENDNNIHEGKEEAEEKQVLANNEKAHNLRKRKPKKA